MFYFEIFSIFLKFHSFGLVLSIFKKKIGNRTIWKSIIFVNFLIDF